MNMKQMKNMISQFRSADLSQVKDADMRARAEKLQNKQGGFTLLELLVVVAILAIIAGAVISSLDGQEELAAQKTTVHTMAALEEGFRVYEATRARTLPGDLDSLLCSTAVEASAATAPAYTGLATTSSILGGQSNVARVGGGITLDLAENIANVDMASSAVAVLADTGVTSLRYVDADFCNDVAADDATSGNVDTALVDVVKPNLIFKDIIEEDGDWEFGAGQSVDLSTYVNDATFENVPMAAMVETAEITGAENDVVVIFGVGPDSEIIGDIIARAPSDGNAGPDKYGNFSVAVKIGSCEDEDEEFISGGAINAACDVDYLDKGEVVAILDAGGDAYDDEIAESRGNQEE